MLQREATGGVVRSASGGVLWTVGVMRAFFLAFVLSLLGGLFGFWRSVSDWNRLGDKIGEVVDASALELASAEVHLEQAPVAANAGTVDPRSIPRVEVVGGVEFDFGNMRAGTERSHSFRFKNSGSAPLQLTVVGSSCKCTIGSLEKSLLGPGEETRVTLTWKAEGVIGDFAQTATIGTNDPRQQEIQLTIRGRLGRTYVAEPAELNFGEFSTREAFEKTFQLYSYEDTPLELMAYWADLDQPLIQVTHTVRRLAPQEVTRYADARYVADCVVRVQPGLPAGPLTGQIHLEIGSDKTPMSVLCSGTCVSDLRIIAGSLYFPKLNTLALGRVPSREGGRANFFIAARKTSEAPIELKLKSIFPEEDKERLRVEIGPPADKASQKLFPVSIVIPPGTAPFIRSGATEGDVVTLTFQTDTENPLEIQIKVRVTVVE